MNCFELQVFLMPIDSNSGYVPDEVTVMSLFRAPAIPTIEQLPGFDPEHAPREYAKTFIEQPKFEKEEITCGS